MEISIRTLEECLFRAWPALETRHYDGWVLRFADGYTGRANSVNPIYGSTLDLEEKINHCEQIYTKQKLPSRFRITDEVYPTDLPKILSEREYIQVSPTNVQTLDLEKVKASSDQDLHIGPYLSERWLTEFLRMNSKNERHRSAMQQLLELIQPNTAFATLHKGSNVVAVGLGVCDGDYIGLFMIVVDEGHRKQGFGTAMTMGLLDWGKANGAKYAYLQVEQDNIPALDLYKNLGFCHFYGYRYYLKDLTE
jgi:N-acetylglutamate synthase